MMHTRRARFCGLISRGIAHQQSTVRGFRALAELAPNMDSRDLMLVLAHNAHTSIRALRRQHRLHCMQQNNNLR